jgi:hypothetical protein
LRNHNNPERGTVINRSYPNGTKRAMELLEWFEREKQERLLRRVNSVPKASMFSFGKRLNKCEASALTTELTAPNRAYFNIVKPDCKTRAHCAALRNCPSG